MNNILKACKVKKVKVTDFLSFLDKDDIEAGPQAELFLLNIYKHMNRFILPKVIIRHT